MALKIIEAGYSSFTTGESIIGRQERVAMRRGIVHDDPQFGLVHVELFGYPLLKGASVIVYEYSPTLSEEIDIEKEKDIKVHVLRLENLRRPQQTTIGSLRVRST